MSGNHLKKSVFWATVLFAFLSFTAVAHASLVDDLKKSIEQKNEEIKKLEEQAQQYRSEIQTQSQKGKTLKAELTRIENNIKQLQKEIALNKGKLQKTELEIQQSKIEINGKENDIQKLQTGLSSIIQALAESDREQPIKILLKHKALSDFFSQLDYAGFLQKKTLSALGELRALKEELKIKKAHAEEKKWELESLKKTLQVQKNTTEDIKKDKNSLLTTTKNQEQRYQAMLKETERKQEEILKEVEALEEDLRKLVDPTSLPKTGRNVLLKPVDGPLTQGYGETAFAKRRDFYKFHNGIDICAPVGTLVRAADSGIIFGTGNTDQYCPGAVYGRYIVIKHSSNLATMYAHLSSINVSSGQQVNRGDIIGYVGMSGLTTGPHLHFTVYDSRTVEIKTGPTGACGPLPYGGSVNPLDYL